MIDISKIPLGGKLSPEEQEIFERRARLDDNDDPPIVIDKNGNYTYDIDIEDNTL